MNRYQLEKNLMNRFITPEIIDFLPKESRVDIVAFSENHFAFFMQYGGGAFDHDVEVRLSDNEITVTIHQRNHSTHTIERFTKHVNAAYWIVPAMKEYLRERDRNVSTQ